MILAQAIMASNTGGGVFTPPGPGSFSPPNSLNTSYGARGTPYDPGSAVSSVTNGTSGFVRKTYLGTWTSNFTDANPSIFDGTPYQTITDDSYISFGLQETRGDNYCMEWKGYFKSSTTTSWNFKAEADDVAMVWIGDAALNPTNSNWVCNSGTDYGLCANSLSLTQDMWYPIRVRYQEWSGAESISIFGAPAAFDLAALYQLGWMNIQHNSGTQGY